MEKAAPLYAKNKRLQESVDDLEKSLATAHHDKEELRARLSRVESENLALTEQENGKATGYMM